MEITLRRLLELAVHVKLASEAVLAAANHLAELRPEDDGAGGAWCRTMDQLMTLNVELGFMERLLSSATGGDVVLPRPARNGRAVPA